MKKTQEKNLPFRFPLVAVHVVRPRGKTSFSSLFEALEAIASWVGFGEAGRIFEKTFRL